MSYICKTPEQSEAVVKLAELLKRLKDESLADWSREVAAHIEADYKARGWA